MARRNIKGITVEINGSTTGLDKALSGVNLKLSNVQKSLKDTDRLLKLDPGNTDLVAQKQRLLADNITNTKEKLASLTEAQKQAKEQLESGTLGQDKYDALQREIIETEQELKNLQTEAATTNEKIAALDATGSKLEKVGGAITGAGQKMMGVTTVVAGVGAAAVKTTADFDGAMSNVAAISGATGDDIDKLRAKAREMGSQTKFSASEAADAMSYMAMVGWKTDDMLDGIDGVMNLAAASGEDLATTSDIVTDALTAFGLKAEDSGHFADILAAASSNANTNVSMMGETFKYAAPVAGALGFSAEDTAEAIGLMANAGIKSSQAGTSLRSIMNELAGAAKDGGLAIGDTTVAVTNADGSMRDLSDILADCRGAFSNLSEAEQASTAKSIAGKNAMSGFLALMNASQGDVDKLSSAIDSCSDTFVKTTDGAIIPMSQALEEGKKWTEEYQGESARMAAVMQDNLGGQLTILKSQLEELAISFGEILMPTVRDIVAAVQGFVDKLNSMSNAQKRTITTIAIVVAAIGPVLIVIGTVITKIGACMKTISMLMGTVGKLKVALASGEGALGSLGTALTTIGAGPIIAVIAAIGLLIGAFVSLWKNNEDFRNNIIAPWTQIKATIAGFIDGVSQRLAGIGITFESVTGAIRTVWEGFCNFMAPVFETAFSIIATILQTVCDALLGVLDFFIGIFTGNWQQAWTGVKEFFGSIWEGIKAIFGPILEGIKETATTAWTTISEKIKEILTAIHDFFAEKWEAIKTKVSDVIGNIKETISSGIETAKETLSSTLDAIHDKFSEIWEGAKSIVSGAIDYIKGLFDFDWHLPDIALPHFSIDGEFSLNPPSIPHVSVDWYKKAMDSARVLTGPSIFGYDAKANRLLAGGEAGREVVSGEGHLIDLIDSVVGNRFGALDGVLGRLGDAVEKYLPRIAEGQNKPVVLDTGAAVGGLGKPMNRQLNIYAEREKWQ